METTAHDLPLTGSQGNYLKQIFLLAESGGSVSTQSLSDRLGVRPASVTGMVRKLAGMGFLEHRKYRGVRLTDAGTRVALELLRHHRLLETYLAETLGYGWDEVHMEAERLEHVISERLEERIAEALGHPTRDPHGDPIPDVDLRMPRSGPEVTLAEAVPASWRSVSRVAVQDPDSLNLLGDLGLTPGAEVKVIEQGAGGVRVVVSGRGRYLVPMSLAVEVWLNEESS